MKIISLGVLALLTTLSFSTSAFASGAIANVLLLIDLVLLYLLFKLADKFIAPFIQKICTRFQIHVLVIYIAYFLFFIFVMA
ncbi:hypothetical protein ABD73_16385 [Brevibacillus laterosporus]|nr:hypothetical protein [Brevibacillus laterosporus]